jgi:hypothetical protein
MSINLTETQIFLLIIGMVVVAFIYSIHIALRRIQDQRLKEVICGLGTDTRITAADFSKQAVCSERRARSFLRRESRTYAIERMGDGWYRLTSNGSHRYSNEIRIRGGYPARA